MAALDVVVVPVADVDRSIGFYVDALGFAADHDTTTPGGDRLVQLTPRGSAASITVGTVTPTGEPVRMAPGGIERYDGGSLRPATAAAELDRVGFVRVQDPDGNGWVVQQLGGRRVDARR